MRIPQLKEPGNCLLFSLMTWVLNTDCVIMKRFNTKRGAFTYFVVSEDEETSWVYRDNDEPEKKLLFNGTPTEMPYKWNHHNELFLPPSDKPEEEKMARALIIFGQEAIRHTIAKTGEFLKTVNEQQS